MTKTVRALTLTAATGMLALTAACGSHHTHTHGVPVVAVHHYSSHPAPTTHVIVHHVHHVVVHPAAPKTSSKFRKH
jgi:outer membrane lipopolysaccharide assembly protein LptE/RlpB